MSRKRRSFEVESLEGKLLLSTVQAALATDTTPVLNGTFMSNAKEVRGTGTTTATITEPFAGNSSSLRHAKGTLTEVVNTTAGTIISADFVVQNSKGSVQLNFTESGLISSKSTKTSNSEVLAYTVGGGTGEFANATGAGTFTMSYAFKSGAVKVTLKST